MSNEKPVRITVGDVKEVTEATTIQGDAPASRSVSSVSYSASVPNNSGNGMVIAGGLVGFVLFVLAGYFGLGQGVTAEMPKTQAAKSSSATTKPVVAPDASAPVANAPAAAGTATNAPAPEKTAANNAPTSAANAPAPNGMAANAPALANNAPK